MGVVIPTPLVRWSEIEIPGLKLGFTSRRGGYSSGDFSSLNLGFHVPDDPESVALNRTALARELGTEIVWMDQIHSAVVADASSARLCTVGTTSQLSVGKADAIVVDPAKVDDGGISIAVMVADCIPLLVADRHGRRAAAVHVGRAGMNLGIAVSVVDMFLAAGSEPSDLVAIAGPSICGQCYEVPAELATEIGLRHPASVVETRWGTTGIDVEAGLREQLATRGVELASLRQCTYENHEFFSHRRATHEGHLTGRFVGIVSVLPRNSRHTG